LLVRLGFVDFSIIVEFSNTLVIDKLVKIEF